MNTPVDRARVFRVFLEALDVDPELRDRFLGQQCQGNEAIRTEVEALLQVAMRDEAHTGAFLAPAPDRETDLSGSDFGRFRLVERIGVGGMGVVYRAERVDGVKQTVAVKLVSANAPLAGQARFEREAQHLARLEHPAIARLIDAGFEHGRAWLVMEFVRGERIDDYCAARSLSERGIVGLIVRIAEALVAAHRELVVHSDIKPANVLVTAEGAPKLIDFGISTALRDAGAQTAATVGVERLFSPGFAAPEQIQGGSVTVATDVFGLGALAYRLLTGRPIFPEVSDPVAYMLAIVQRDVDLPSRVALETEPSYGAAHRLRGDLDAILCKALERDPARRYASVAELQSDLQCYLDGKPVSAHRQTMSYRLGKFVRRNALAVGLVGLLLASLGVGGALALRESHRESLARDMAARRGEFLVSLLQSADQRLGRREVTVAELLDSAAAELHRKLGSEPLAEASMLGMIAQTNSGLGRFPEGLAANGRQLAILQASGGDAAEIGRAVATRGELLASQGKWLEAEPVLREAVTMLRPLPADAELCSALNVLGGVYAHSNREKEAEATYREEIALETQCGADPRQRRMYPYRSLAVMMGELGRYEEAATYGRQALELARQSLPADHPDLLNIQTNYAGSLVNVKRGAEAEPLLREVIAAQTRVDGAGHKDTLLTQYSLADLLLAMQRDAEAAELARSVAQGLEAALGPDNTYTLGARLMYGTAICNLGSHEAGLATLQQVEATRRRVLPAGAWLTDAAAVGVGSCLVRAHRYREAEGVLLSAVGALEISRGVGFRRTQEGIAALRDAYLGMGRADDAGRWSKKLLS
jgi:serine/threonine-protein kinase